MSRVDLETTMLTRLGLPKEAGPEEIEAAYADVVAYINAAPADLRGWAKGQLAAADEAYALLSDPSAAISVEEAPAEKKPRAATTRHARAEKQELAAAAALRTRRVGRAGRALIASLVLLGVVAAGYAVYASDRPSVPGLTGTPAPEASAGPDMQRVAQLMQTISTDPNDTDALQELADIYFQAGDYTTATDWENKVLAVKPDDVNAHLALGAARFNLGDAASAETNWRRVVELDPNNVEAHYDLGFMYFSADPPATDKALAEWREVVRLAPDSQIAQTVSSHLQTLESWQSSASPGASAPAASVPAAAATNPATAAPPASSTAP